MHLVAYLFGISILMTLFNNHNKMKDEAIQMWSIERIDPLLDSIINDDVNVEIIAEGFDWTEGPIWIEEKKMLLFSDIPKNSIYKWTEAKGTEVYLTPSGYTSSVPRGGETGSNALLLNKKGQLVLCQHGDRRMAVMIAPIDKPKPEFKSIADSFKGKKFNSPNDAVFHSNGDLFFTDPPYGLEKNMNDPLKEIPFQGVYRVKPSGEVILVADSITRPNGIGLTIDEKTLIVANSDGKNPYWYAIDLLADGSHSKPRIFYDATEAARLERGGLDGFKIGRNGTMYATGPGGIWILDKNAKVLGKIKWKGATSNIALSPDEKTLYVTADMYVLRIKMR